MATAGFILLSFSDKLLPHGCGCFKSLLHYLGWLIFLLAFFPANIGWTVFASLIRHSANGDIIAMDKGLFENIGDWYGGADFMIEASQDNKDNGYMPISGLFIQIWLFVTYGLFGLFMLCCTCCVCCKVGIVKPIDTLIRCLRR